MELPEYTEKTGHQTRTTRTYIPIYIYISEISNNRECARFARSIKFLNTARDSGGGDPLPFISKKVKGRLGQTKTTLAKSFMNRLSSLNQCYTSILLVSCLACCSVLYCVGDSLASYRYPGPSGERIHMRQFFPLFWETGFFTRDTKNIN